MNPALFQRPLPERDGPLSWHHRSPEACVFSTPLPPGSLDTSMSTLAFECGLLGPFALSVSFSQAAAERDFRDYSGHSVPIHLAVVRATPSCLQEPQFVLQVSFTSFPSP